MELAKRPPHPALASHIRSVAGWFEDGAPVSRRELPGGRVVLVISFGPQMDIDGRRFGSFVAGVHDAPTLTEHDGLGHGVEVYFTPLGARRFLGMPMRELTGRVVELEDLLGPKAHELAERLHEERGWPAWLALLERVVAGRVVEAEPPPVGLEWAWRRLLDTDGAVAIGALAQELGWSRRHLSAQFREHVGVPPKTLARLLRFERAAKLLRGPDAPDLGRLALDCGYYDQAHFNRDFRAFAGATPTEYRVTSVQAIESVAA
jgi:AraC-like DNA-binding protein